MESDINECNTMPIIIHEKYKKLKAKRKNSDVSICSNPDTNNKHNINYRRKMIKIVNETQQRKITDYFIKSTI